MGGGKVGKKDKKGRGLSKCVKKWKKENKFQLLIIELFYLPIILIIH